MSFKNYLEKQYSKSTGDRYLKAVEKFESIQIKASKSLYRDVFEYLSNLKEQSGYHVASSTLGALKAYYDYLQVENLRTDHPCKKLYLKSDGSKDVQLQDLFSVTELQSLLAHESLTNGHQTHYDFQLRNKCILQLLINQGLHAREIVNLTLKDINLEQGMVNVHENSQALGRELKLKSNQVFNLYKYQNEGRVKLLNRQEANEKRKNQNILFLTEKGRASNETVCLILRKMQESFHPRKLNPVKIRQSVITNKLKQGFDIRIVQAFSGHKTTSSLQRYQQNNVEQLKASIDKFHPLG